MTALKKLLIALVALLLISGCASVTRGTKDTLVVESVPAGAQVRLSTGGTGKTPTSFQLPRKQMLDVFIEKEGYEPLTVHVSSQVSGTGAVGMAGNVLIGGLVGIGVDTWTGASKDLRPNPIKVTLVALKPAVKPEAAAASGPDAVKPAEPAVAGTAEVAVASAPPAASAGSAPASDFKPVGTQVGTLPLAKGMDAAKVQDLICSVLLAREWEVQEKAGGHVVGHIKRRSSEAVLTLVYEPTRIEMFCEGWKIDKKSGSHLKPDLPNSWIENIRNDLTARLAQMPAAS